MHTGRPGVSVSQWHAAMQHCAAEATIPVWNWYPLSHWLHCSSYATQTHVSPTEIPILVYTKTSVRAWESCSLPVQRARASNCSWEEGRRVLTVVVPTVQDSTACDVRVASGFVCWPLVTPVEQRRGPQLSHAGDILSR